MWFVVQYDMAKAPHYDERFKESAVRLSYEYGNIMKAARRLGIPYALLYGWRKEYPMVRLNFSGKKENPDGEVTVRRKTRK